MDDMRDGLELGGLERGGVGRGIGRSGRVGGSARAAALALPAPERTVSRCLVCGSREVRTDEVDGAPRQHRGWVLLAECRHCDHRWTRPLPDEAAPRRVASVGVASVAPERPADAEVASAA